MPIYFDNAATSHPKPPSVIRAVRRALTETNANPGRSGHSAAIEAGRTVLEAREKLAALMNAEDPMNVVHCFNCTDALNLAIKGSLHVGDHVVTTWLEHNAVLRVLSALEQRRRISLTMVPPRPDGFVDPDDIRAAITCRPALIVCTHASNVTGAIQPVAAIGQVARSAGVRYLIDGAQALGGMPVDVRALGCDLYAFPGHKSLLGPQGTGGLYIADGLRLNPLREGGTGTDSQSLLQPDTLPERYESGTVNLPGIAGLAAGCDYIAPRLSQIMMHERELTQALFDGLAAMDGVTLYSPAQEAGRAGIVCFNVGDKSSAQVADTLSRRDIAVRGGLHCAPGAHRFLGTLNRGAVRASLGHANTFGEVEQFLKSVRELL